MCYNLFVKIEKSIKSSFCTLKRILFTKKLLNIENILIDVGINYYFVKKMYKYSKYICTKVLFVIEIKTF